MSIFDNIYNAMIDYKIATGKGPNNIYLGHNEMQELRTSKDVFTHIIMDYSAQSKRVRPKMCGILLYEVDDDNHLAVG